MSEFDGLWKHENNQHAFVPPKTNVAAQVAPEEFKNGHPSYGGTQKKREKKRSCESGTHSVTLVNNLEMLNLCKNSHVQTKYTPTGICE